MFPLHDFLTIALLHLLAVISPGPDFALISRNSLVYSRRTGVYSALGIALGILVHVTYCVVGVGLLIASSVVLFSMVKFLGAAYLIFIGWQSLRTKSVSEHNGETSGVSHRDLPMLQALRTGFLTNVLNPKATLFFLSVFTQFVHATTPIWVKAIYGIELSIITFAWFAFVAIALSHPRVRLKLSALQPQVERVMGVLLIALGLRVAFLHSV